MQLIGPFQRMRSVRMHACAKQVCSVQAERSVHDFLACMRREAEARELESIIAAADGKS